MKEANGKVAPETLQAALVELKSGFDLNSQRLIELDQAGIPDSVIDLMVALSFPKRFVVEKNTSGSGGSWGVSGFDSMWPYFTEPYVYTSYYAPFGYRYWGYYDSYYFQGPGFVIVNPEPSIQPSGDGRVVDGRGYTRVRRSDPDPSGRPSGSGSGGGTASAGASSSNGGGVSSSGYSGRGGGGDRTAQPRPPNQ